MTHTIHIRPEACAYDVDGAVTDRIYLLIHAQSTAVITSAHDRGRALALRAALEPHLPTGYEGTAEIERLLASIASDLPPDTPHSAAPQYRLRGTDRIVEIQAVEGRYGRWVINADRTGTAYLVPTHTLDAA